MPRKYIRKPNVIWTKKGLQDALAERSAAGTSFRKLSVKYNVPLGTMHRHVGLQKRGLFGEQRERKTVFTAKQEQQLKECILDLA